MLPGQMDLPGTGPEPLRVTLERKAAAPLKPTAPQKPPDAGLFGDEHAQLDLVDLAKGGTGLA